MLNGYKYVYAPEHPRAMSNGVVYEHIIVAEKILGRHLNKGEVVHHIDKDRTNNKPENLMVFANDAEHLAFHMTGKAYSLNDVWFAERKFKHCIWCNTLFIPDHNDNKYCSHACANSAKSKISNISLDVLKNELVAANGNFSFVGKKHNVTANAIVKLLKKNNLPYHSKDYKNETL